MARKRWNWSKELSPRCGGDGYRHAGAQRYGSHTTDLAKEYPQVKVVGLSMHSSDKYVREMFKAGASGYLLKGLRV